MDRRHLLKTSSALGGIVGAAEAKAATAQALASQAVRELLMDAGVMMIDTGVPGALSKGYGCSNEVPDRAGAERTVRVMEEHYSRFPANPV